jgi:two-component system, response regulator
MDVEPARILMVEDDPYDVELLQLALEGLNIANQIEVVHDGEQALHYLLGQGGKPPTAALPTLILLDLKLPKVSGLQVLERLRQNIRTRNLVIVVITSSQEDSDLTICYELGVNSYIVKPLDFQQFMDVARQVGQYWLLLNRSPLPQHRH